MKRCACIFLAVLMVLLCTACSGDGSAPESTVQTTAATTVQTTQAPEGIKNMILIISDGTGDAQIEAGTLTSGKAPPFEDWTHTHVNTNSLDAAAAATVTTDSAAAATALATGTLTTNGRIGMDAAGNNLKTILDYANELGKSTGVVTNDYLTGATPAAFSAHAGNREDTDTISTSQLYSDVTLLCGDFNADNMGSKSLIEYAGYTYCDSITATQKAMDAPKAYWQLSDKLETVTPQALAYLSQDPDGFVLMIEQAHVDTNSHKNNFDGMQRYVISLDNTVQAVLDWAKDRTDTAIIITADHETGGLSVGTAGTYKNTYTTTAGETISYQWTTTGHTPTPVSVYCWGFEPDFSQYAMEGEETLIKNTAVFQIMLDLLQQ